MITVFPVGSKVTIDNEADIQATMTQISLVGLDHRIRYLCEWWDGRKIVSEWFDEYRVGPCPGVVSVKIGFKTEHGQ